MTANINSREKIVVSGAERSIAVLASMLGQDIEVGALTQGRLSLDEVSQRAGGPGQGLTVVYLTYWGDASGHMTLLLNDEVTSKLLELLAGLPHTPGQQFNEFERSALGELGNVIGSSFLNSIADATGLRIRPSPPDVVVDMVGAVVDIVAADVMDDSTDAYVVEVPFRAAKSGVEGTFLIIPSSDLLAAISSMTGVSQ